MSEYDDDLLGDPVDLDDIVENYGIEEDQNDQNNENDVNENPPEENANGNDDTTGKTAIQPKKKVIRSKRFLLDPNLLRGPKGIATLEGFFKDFKFKGKHHEKEDLDRLMSYLGYWCHQLYPKYQFDDCLERIEKLGSKKIVQTYVKKIRMGMVDDLPDNTIRGLEDGNTDEPLELDNLNLDDEIDQYLAQPALQNRNAELFRDHNRSGSSQSRPGTSTDLSEDAKQRILRNKQLAMEKRMARLRHLEALQNDDNQPMEHLNGVNMISQDSTGSRIPEIDDSFSQISENGVETMETNQPLISSQNPEQNGSQMNPSLDSLSLPSSSQLTPNVGALQNMQNGGSLENNGVQSMETSTKSLSEQQRERMIRNRKVAEELRLAKFKKIQNTEETNNASDLIVDGME